MNAFLDLETIKSATEQVCKADVLSKNRKREVVIAKKIMELLLVSVPITT